MNPLARARAGRTRPLPVFLRLAGRRVVVVGAGAVAAGKLPALLATGASISVVAPDVRRDRGRR
jgi:uroporphyrin-III C-methyltransferase/precorrin-2 dehydrogenase/sirohydrochlorin ferrochelatase